MKITIDFDNTLAIDDYPCVGKEVPGAIAYVEKLYNDGHTLILFTCREGEALDAAYDWMCYTGIVEYFAAINCWDQDSLDKWEGLDCRKIVGQMNIDDRNVGCPLITVDGVDVVDWKEVYRLVYLRSRGVA